MITIYSEKESTRFRYIINELFCFMHGFDVEITTDPEYFASIAEEQPKICYAKERINNSLHINPSTLLFENCIRPQNIDVHNDGQYFHLFETGIESSYEYAYDIFSASFFLITRYEEYLDHKPDLHGRFRAEDSTAFKHCFLEEPVVDQWMKELVDKLRSLFPSTPKSKREFKHVKTIDVDNVFAYQHKGLLINAINIIKDLANRKYSLVRKRLRVLLRMQKDPYFNLEELADTLKKHSDSTYFFFHCGGYGKHDKKTIIPSLSYANVKNKLSRMGFNIGLHPSYRSAHKQWLFKLEKKTLEFHIKKVITACRAHYLLYTLPKDYEMLVEEGMTDDFTMGYSNNPGFRAGTSIPYHFYNLKEEKPTLLTIHPLSVMDKTLHSNLGLDTVQAKTYILRLAQKVKEVNGDFVTLFHNENQTDAEGFGWYGWNKMYKDLLDRL